MKALRDFAIISSITLLLLVIGLVLVEGVNTLLLYKEAKPSLTYRALFSLEQKCFPERVRRRQARREQRAEAERIQRAQEQYQSAQNQYQTARDGKNNDGMSELLSKDILFTFQIEKIFEKLRSSGVLLGNSPYDDLITKEVRVATDDPVEGYRVKPNLAFEGAYLRTRLYDPNNLLFYYVDLERKKKTDPEVLSFLAQYAFHPVICHTDKDSNRATVPASRSNDIILVVGDSVAFGIDINDDETLASQLQKADPSVRYINASCPGTDSKQHRARLPRLFAQYGDKIKGIVYVNCENDYDYGPNEAEHIVDYLADILDAHHVNHRVFVCAQHITRTIPEIFRTGWLTQNTDLAKFIRYKEIMREVSAKRGFRTFVDFGKIVHDYQEKQGSLYAGAALYNDECHLSPLGFRLIADQIPLYSRSK